jgi:hypothetical protein
MAAARAGTTIDRAKPESEREMRKRAEKSKVKETALLKCEICGSDLPAGEYPSGCEECGKLFGSCCNSLKDDTCIDCS